MCFSRSNSECMYTNTESSTSTLPSSLIEELWHMLLIVTVITLIHLFWMGQLLGSSKDMPSFQRSLSFPSSHTVYIHSQDLLFLFRPIYSVTQTQTLVLLATVGMNGCIYVNVQSFVFQVNSSDRFEYKPKFMPQFVSKQISPHSPTLLQTLSEFGMSHTVGKFVLSVTSW